MSYHGNRRPPPVFTTLPPHRSAAQPPPPHCTTQPPSHKYPRAATNIASTIASSSRPHASQGASLQAALAASMAPGSGSASRSTVPPPSASSRIVLSTQMPREAPSSSTNPGQAGTPSSFKLKQSAQAPTSTPQPTASSSQSTTATSAPLKIVCLRATVLPDAYSIPQIYLTDPYQPHISLQSEILTIHLDPSIAAELTRTFSAPDDLLLYLFINPDDFVSAFPQIETAYTGQIALKIPVGLFCWSHDGVGGFCASIEWVLVAARVLGQQDKKALREIGRSLTSKELGGVLVVDGWTWMWDDGEKKGGQGGPRK